MAGGVVSELAQSSKSKAWFEELGLRGLASLGAVLGLNLAIAIIGLTALLLDASPTQSKSRAVVQAERPTSEGVKPSVTPDQALPAGPQPLVSTPKTHASVLADPPSNA